MTQPNSKRGPVTPGASQRFGNSAQGIANTLASIQQSARGIGEWIDGQGTGASHAPAFAHDHRGGIWGRPLGIGFSCPMVMRGGGFGANFEAETFCNVPDPRALSGDELDDAEANGGYSFVDVYLYVGSIFAFQTLQFKVAVWAGDRWTDEQTHNIDLPAPGAGPQWIKLAKGLHLPPGLVRIKARDFGLATDWHWVSFVVPQR